MTDAGPRCVRRLPAWFAFLLPLAALADPPVPAPGGSEVTLLNPVFVEASTHTPWRYFNGGGFEVLSHCPDEFNRAFVAALRKSAAARLAVLPPSLWGQIPTPIKVVLYDRPPEKGAGIIPANPVDLSWAPENGAVVGSDSVQLSHPVTVGDGDTFISCGNYWNMDSASRDFSVDLDSEILIENRVPRLPAWFVAGVVGPRGIYANRMIRSGPSGDVEVLPSALWATIPDTLALQDERKERDKGAAPRGTHALLPLGDLFAGRVGPGQGHLWEAEAALLVRWGLFGRGDNKAFLDFVDQAAREPATEELFRKCLGIGYAGAEEQLLQYLPLAVTEPIRIPIAAPAAPEPIFRDASSTEVARIVGDWGRLEGRAAGPEFLEYRNECLEQADRLFERASGGRNANAPFLAAFGLYEIQAGDDQRARAALEAATQAGVARPRAYLELARLRLRAALPSVQQGIGDLGEADFADILALLATAREQMPSLLPAYQTLAQAYEHAPSRPARADLGAIDEGLRLFPRDAALAYKVATLYRNLGLAEEADALVARALRLAETDDARALLSSWRPRPRKG